MQRSNLATVVLQLKALGIDDVLHFDFMSPPPAEMMIRALELLHALGALDDHCKLTPTIGNYMAECPLDPMLAKMLLSSGEFKCSEEIVTIAAMLSVQAIFVPKDFKSSAFEKTLTKFAVKEGDHIALLNVYNTFIKLKKEHINNWCQTYSINLRALNRAVDIRKQLVKYLKRFGIKMQSCTDLVAIRKCIVSGFFSNAAFVAPDGTYRTVRDSYSLSIHPSSVLYKDTPECVIFHEVIETAKEYMRDLTLIEPIWLAEAAPHFYEWKGRPPSSTDTPPEPKEKPIRIEKTVPDYWRKDSP